MSQAHGLSLWRESAGSGAVPTAVPAYLVADGADVSWNTSGPERFAFYDVEQNGNYWLLDLTPVYLVSDGAGGLTINQVGPAIALLIDDGAGGMQVSTDLTQPPIADLSYDTGGDLWVVRRNCPRLHAVQVGGQVQFY